MYWYCNPYTIYLVIFLSSFLWGKVGWAWAWAFQWRGLLFGFCCRVLIRVFTMGLIFNDFLSGVYTSFTDHCKIEAADSQLPDLVDYDEYDAKVFRNPSAAGHFALKGFPPRGSGFRRIRSAMEMQRMAKSVSKDEITSHKFVSPKGISSYEDLLVSASSSSSTMLTVSNKLDLPTSRA